jgi:hypothetical protein
MSVSTNYAPLSRHPGLTAGRSAAIFVLNSLMYLAFGPARVRPAVMDPQVQQAVRDEAWPHFARCFCFMWARKCHQEEAATAIANIQELLVPREPCEFAGITAASHAEAILQISDNLYWLLQGIPGIVKGIELAEEILRDSGADTERNVAGAIDVMFVAEIPTDELDEYLKNRINSLLSDPVPGECPDETCRRWRRVRDRLRESTLLQEQIDSVDWQRMRRSVCLQLSFDLDLDLDSVRARLDIEFREAARAWPVSEPHQDLLGDHELSTELTATRDATGDGERESAALPKLNTPQPQRPDGFDESDRFWVGGKEVRFGRAGLRRQLVLALWDKKRGEPKAQQKVHDVIGAVYSEPLHTSDAAYRQLCSDTNRSVFEAGGLPFRIRNEDGCVRLERFPE